MNKNNSWRNKFIRTLSSFLPVSKERMWNCNRCWNCCKLPNKCFFLRYDQTWKSYCIIYKYKILRPLNCIKYPRNSKEQITKETCWYYFKK